MTDYDTFFQIGAYVFGFSGLVAAGWMALRQPETPIIVQTESTLEQVFDDYFLHGKTRKWYETNLTGRRPTFGLQYNPPHADEITPLETTLEKLAGPPIYQPKDDSNSQYPTKQSPKIYGLDGVVIEVAGPNKPLKVKAANEETLTDATNLLIKHIPWLKVMGGQKNKEVPEEYKDPKAMLDQS